jgi:hypothetical protein
MIYFYLFKKMKIFIHDNTKIVQFVGIYNIIINYFTIPIISFRNENLQYIGTIKNNYVFDPYIDIFLLIQCFIKIFQLISFEVIATILIGFSP